MTEVEARLLLAAVILVALGTGLAVGAWRWGR
jgi:hypothetical protein